ncbi:hypothetical protein C8F04DRAFT_1232648 [Mycena alexandri]|uniref:Uncharacterized protein n=1 Tax=Mycena alexandri TaxID=1745969 RepID=A0AAD6X3F2_9AGAR|nr:hypothetical protein C8F04DRAFT_1232648 [Mycena alexandri]
MQNEYLVVKWEEKPDKMGGYVVFKIDGGLDHGLCQVDEQVIRGRRKGNLPPLTEHHVLQLHYSMEVTPECKNVARTVLFLREDIVWLSSGGWENQQNTAVELVLYSLLDMQISKYGRSAFTKSPTTIWSRLCAGLDENKNVLKFLKAVDTLPGVALPNHLDSSDNSRLLKCASLSLAFSSDATRPVFRDKSRTDMLAEPGNVKQGVVSEAELTVTLVFTYLCFSRFLIEDVGHSGSIPRKLQKWTSYFIEASWTRQLQGRRTRAQRKAPAHDEIPPPTGYRPRLVPRSKRDVGPQRRIAQGRRSPRTTDMSQPPRSHNYPVADSLRLRLRGRRGPRKYCADNFRRNAPNDRQDSTIFLKRSSACIRSSAPSGRPTSSDKFGAHAINLLAFGDKDGVYCSHFVRERRLIAG